MKHPLTELIDVLEGHGIFTNMAGFMGPQYATFSRNWVRRHPDTADAIWAYIVKIVEETPHDGQEAEDPQGRSGEAQG